MTSGATKLRCLALIALVLWTGGAGCLLCCAGSLIGDYWHEFGPPLSSGATAEAACGSHDCCALRERGSKSASVSEPIVAARCCLLAGRPNPAAFPRYHQVAVSLLQELVNSPEPCGSTEPSAVLNNTAPHNRSSTYLFCCALLI